MKTARETAEGAVIVAKMRFRNAQLHREGVKDRFGAASPGYQRAGAVLLEAKRDLVRAFDAAIAIDRTAAFPSDPSRQ